MSYSPGLCNCDQDAPSPSGGRIPKLQDCVLRNKRHKMIGDITLVKSELLDTLAAKSKCPKAHSYLLLVLRETGLFLCKLEGP